MRRAHSTLGYRADRRYERRYEQGRNGQVRGVPMKSRLSWTAMAAVLTVAMPLMAAQGRGGRNGGDGEAQAPTEKQFAESAPAQAHVATAMKLAGADLVPQARMFCTNTGPLRLALARQAAGLPPIDNYVIEPTRVFDNMYFL